jgi:hypothetical protein
MSSGCRQRVRQWSSPRGYEFSVDEEKKHTAWERSLCDAQSWDTSSAIQPQSLGLPLPRRLGSAGVHTRNTAGCAEAVLWDGTSCRNEAPLTPTRRAVLCKP